ncbi:RelA/SpoT domain-containing protein [Belnapia sp. F-4-1]|uniref:RelA/SpoT domain-containing protein n=1 Tax=Belnapia sp. F-4-1 TaxID=1545443 RepID=UPI001184D017|nr:RelA/SpoT domain-containing protein [Belnapia sp. F-4-1]
MPENTPSRVKAAGKRIRSGQFDTTDILVMENWRASHAYILNTFQTTLRSRARGKTITVAQRLKRRNTIFDKLVREPTMQLNTMHDIAGCRLIFQNRSELNEFRASLHRTRSKHKRRYPMEDRYNYIIHPKSSGYRGIHDVYEWFVTTPFGSNWNGLHVEIQYRTIYQHAWATAVEAADLLTTSRIKFSLAEQRYTRFFQLCSEVIARAYEDQRSCLPELSNLELRHELSELEASTGLLASLRDVKHSSEQFAFKANTILIRHTGDAARVRLEVETYDNINEAVERYSVLERQYGGNADIVLVRAKDEMNVRDAFRNYFSDTNDFVSYIDEGQRRL